jgi:5-(carboxyamino)imidazole ribonucleotide synthase
MVQDRSLQKQWLARHGFPLGPFATAATAAELRAAASAFGGPCFVKACRGGYDGRSQVELADPAGAETAFAALGNAPCVVERALSIRAELSVLVARSPRGETVVYPPALNQHAARILDWSVLPAPIDPALATQAVTLARAIAEMAAVEGLLVVELFLLEDGALVVNELAPRPHNTFHATEVGCVTSQFEQLVRAVCNLPLGSAEVVRPAAIVNLLGDLWSNDAQPAFDAALATPGVRLHLYGKRIARPGRKMGHLSATGSTPAEARDRVLAARDRLRRPA